MDIAQNKPTFKKILKPARHLSFFVLDSLTTCLKENPILCWRMFRAPCSFLSVMRRAMSLPAEEFTKHC